MRWDRTFLRSKVARRITLLFVLCALLPIVILAVLSFTQVTRHLNQQSQIRLHQTNKAMAMAIFERLLVLESEMERVSSNINEISEIFLFNLSSDFTAYLKERFKGLFLLTPKGKPLAIFGNIQDLPALSPEDKQYLHLGKTVISTRLNPEGPAHIFISRALRPELSDQHILLAEIEPLFLWYMGYEKPLPPMTEFCVLDHSNNILFSSVELPVSFFKPAMRKMDHSSSSQFEWEHNNQKYLANLRNVFMESQFFSPNWKIVLSEAKSYVHAPIVYFKKTFPFVVLLSLWVVLILSVSQIRRNLVPLEKLKKGAQCIAQKDFETKVQVDSHDEFEELARTFNTMAQQLGRQFKTLTTIAEIHRAILSTMDTDKIINTVLNRISAVFPSRGIGFTLIHSNSFDSGQTYIGVGNPSQRRIVEEIQITPDEIQKIKDNPDNFIVKKDDNPPDYLRPLVGQRLRSFHVFPIFLNQNLAGIITIGSDEREILSKEDLNQIRQLSDQVGVALSNAHLVEEVKGFSWGTLVTLARAIDAKSPWTAGHSERATKLALDIGRMMNLSEKEMDILHRGGLLHDIGKLGIPNEILDKKGKLTPEERKIIEKHPALGARILEPLAAFKEIMLVVLEHHENYDGTGYPKGLAGENISLYGRIFIVTDCYDALTSERPYRGALDHDEAVKLIKRDSGTKFDPKVINAFLKIVNRAKKN